jgi:hypothetical protein
MLRLPYFLDNWLTDGSEVIYAKVFIKDTRDNFDVTKAVNQDYTFQTKFGI